MAIRSSQLSAFLTRCPTEHDRLRIHAPDYEQLTPRGIATAACFQHCSRPRSSFQSWITCFSRVGIRPFRYFAEKSPPTISQRSASASSSWEGRARLQEGRREFLQPRICVPASMRAQRRGSGDGNHGAVATTSTIKPTGKSSAVATSAARYRRYRDEPCRGSHQNR
jgi:hypothetical protein